MKNIVLYFALMQLPIVVLAQDYLPRDVQRFVERREGCDHLRGGLDRMNALRGDMRRLCGGTDKELAQLKRKYAANSTIMQILDQFEAGIEIAAASSPEKPVAK